MLSLSKKRETVQLAIGLLPLFLSTVFLITRSWLFIMLCVLSLFIIVGVVPLFKRRENLYMFIMVALAGLPINIRLSFWLVSEEYIESGFYVGNILWIAFLCCVFFSVEEIAFGIITRFIWRRQYKLKI